MADLAALKRELLADGSIDEAEVTRLRTEIYADGTVEAEEVQLLVDLRNEAKQLHPSFTGLFFQALGDYFLADGALDAAEAAELRAILFADGSVRFLEENTSPTLLSNLSNRKDGNVGEEYVRPTTPGGGR